MTFFFKAKIFELTALEIAGTIKTFEGFGFQPKAILVFWNGRPELVTTVGRRNLNGGIGAATSPTNRGCCSVFETDAAATMTGGGRIDNAAVVQRNAADGTATASVDFDSFTADGVKLVIDDDLSTTMQIQILAWGGTDLTDVAVLPFRWGTATGNQDIHGLPFDPSTNSLFLFFGMPSILADPPTADEDVIQLMFGAARSASPIQQYVAVGKEDDDNASSLTKSYVQHGECLASIAGTGTTSPDARAAFVAPLSDGFTLNILEHSPATASSAFVLVLKGGQYHLGDITTLSGNTAEVNVTGLPFQPSGVTVCNIANAATSLESSPDTTNVHWSLTFGSATDSTDQASLALFSQDAQASSAVTTGIHYSRWYAELNGFAPVYGRFLSYLHSNLDGFTFQADASYVPFFFWYIAYSGGGFVPPPPAPPAVVGLQTGGGRDIEGKGDAVYLPAPLFTKPRRVTKIVPPEDEPQPSAPPTEDEPILATAKAPDYRFTGGDFFHETPAPPTLPTPPKIRRGKVTFKLPQVRLRIAPGVVRIEGKARIKITVKEGKARLGIPTPRLRIVGGYRRFKDDAISLGMNRPDLEDALGEWIVD